MASGGGDNCTIEQSIPAGDRGALSVDGHRRRWVVAGLAFAGAIGVAGAVALVLTGDHETDKAFRAMAPSFMGTG